ncbi:MAG TPA: hypothetical protein VND42_04855 [Candidatus Acidoferrales bacterium]|nr:hypothetical protein [Candidatus Acidoferrales bacterium]
MRNILAAPVLSFLLILSAAPLYAQKIVPAGTAVMVRLDKSVSSKNAVANQKVKATVAQDVVIHGKVLIPRGSPAAVYVAEATAAGSSSTPATLYLRLDALTVGGRAYPVSARKAGAQIDPRGKGDPVATGGAVAAGVAAGAATTGGKDISFEPETAVAFRLKSRLRVR